MTEQTEQEARALIPRAAEAARANGGYDMSQWSQEQMVAFLAAVADEYVRIRLARSPF